jgi:hypothetical protein
MKRILVLGLLLGLTACGDHKVALEKTVITVVKPAEATYSTCPQTLDLPEATDTYTGREATKLIYNGYVQCRQTVENIKTELDRLEKVATKDNPKDK